MKIKIKIINAFTESIKGGNPAGVVLNSPNLTDNQMKFICKNLKVSCDNCHFLCNGNTKFFSKSTLYLFNPEYKKWNSPSRDLSYKKR